MTKSWKPADVHILDGGPLQEYIEAFSAKPAIPFHCFLSASGLQALLAQEADLREPPKLVFRWKTVTVFRSLAIVASPSDLKKGNRLKLIEDLQSSQNYGDLLGLSADLASICADIDLVVCGQASLPAATSTLTLLTPKKAEASALLKGAPIGRQEEDDDYLTDRGKWFKSRHCANE